MRWIANYTILEYVKIKKMTLKMSPTPETQKNIFKE
jgi:hypothetical protein